HVADAPEAGEIVLQLGDGRRGPPDVDKEPGEQGDQVKADKNEGTNQEAAAIQPVILPSHLTIPFPVKINAGHGK
ncbi:MAG: hypothetical protein R3322_16070, partial [Kiloniellales bacterium]|nr:hypothetical protein [Kiloniellales bacterium]